MQFDEFLIQGCASVPASSGSDFEVPGIFKLPLAVFLLCLASVAGAESAPPDIDQVEHSYIYAAVMGTGSYQINGRRISMLRLPFSWTQRQPTEESPGWKWLLPVVVGHDSFEGSDWLEELFPTDLVTLTVLPGFEYLYPVNPKWILKPFVQLGAGRDFAIDETIMMTQIGMRSLNLFEPGKLWQLRWGNTLRWAAEYQLKSEDKTSFGVFESGLDVRREMPFKLWQRRFDLGTYYIFQRFMPRWDVSDSPDRRSRAYDLHEFGLSVGFIEPNRIWGVPVQRVRIGYKKGGQLQGITIGTEFPF